jgi:hypothetical protein
MHDVNATGLAVGLFVGVAVGDNVGLLVGLAVTGAARQTPTAAARKASARKCMAGLLYPFGAYPI